MAAGMQAFFASVKQGIRAVRRITNSILHLCSMCSSLQVCLVRVQAVDAGASEITEDIVNDVLQKAAKKPRNT